MKWEYLKRTFCYFIKSESKEKEYYLTTCAFWRLDQQNGVWRLEYCSKAHSGIFIVLNFIIILFLQTIFVKVKKKFPYHAKEIVNVSSCSLGDSLSLVSMFWAERGELRESRIFQAFPSLKGIDKIFEYLNSFEEHAFGTL